MYLQTISTGSIGNSYLLGHGTDTLLLDCGVSMNSIYKAIGFNLSVVDACLLSHAHLDHCSSVENLLKQYIEVIMSEQTKKELNFKTFYPSILTKPYNEIGNWKVKSFALEHDSDNTGFLVQHTETLQKIAYITDSGFIRASLVGVNILLIECNFQDELIKHEDMEDRFQRVKSTHMSLERLLSYLKKIDLSVMTHVILIHLSDTNSNEQQMIDAVEKQTGIKTYAAHNGETIRLNEVPF